METVIKINNVEDIRKFQTDVATFTSDVDLISGRYIIDAKSVMGIFTIDLSKPIVVEIHTDDEVEQNKFIAIMRQFQ